MIEEIELPLDDSKAKKFLFAHANTKFWKWHDITTEDSAMQSWTPAFHQNLPPPALQRSQHVPLTSTMDENDFVESILSGFDFGQGNPEA